MRGKTIRVGPAFDHECGQRLGSVEAQPAALLRKMDKVQSTGTQLLFESRAMGGRGDDDRGPARLQSGAEALNDIGDEKGIARIEVRSMAAVGRGHGRRANLFSNASGGIRRIRKVLHGQGQSNNGAGESDCPWIP